MLSKHYKIDAADIRLSFVRSLYVRRGTLVAGLVAHLVTLLAIWFKVGDPFYLLVGLALTAILVIRMAGMLAFDHVDQRAFTLSDTLSWERRYVTGSVVAAGVLGVLCSYALLVSRDSFAVLAAVSITLASLISVVGRNFGSGRNVDMMIGAACLPLMSGLVITGDPYMFVLAVLLLPMFLTTRSMANGVREFLVTTVMAERKAGLIAERFDIALNNMSHGLIMLDGDGGIEVVNAKASEIFGVSAEVDLRGRRLELVLRIGTRRGVLPAGDRDEIARQLARLARGEARRALVRLSGDKWLEFTSRLRGESGVVLIFEDVSFRVRQEETILQMARFDALTGLPNRSWFGELVSRKLARCRSDQQVALAILDINDFKHVNDTMGHIAGDALLEAVAGRLKSMADGGLIASRFSGDEFVLLFSDPEENGGLNVVMERIMQTLCGHYKIAGHRTFVGLSAGLATASAAHAVLEDLQIRADLALHDAKRRDKNRWSLFVDSMDAEYSARQKLKHDLREAIDSDALDIVYQPMFLPDGSLVLGAEALSRWQHPEMGVISPSVYIPLAEEMGIIGKLTRSMINRAVADCAKWPEDYFVSVNLSAHDLADDAIVVIVDAALEEHGLPASRLHLEITESALVDDPQQVRVILETFRSKGITIAIDDFGTGYSSLSYLDILPFNKVKIDRTFVANIATDERKLKLLRGVVTLSRELGLSIVVEGVETEAQLRVLRDNDCADLIQGYIFSASVRPAAFAELAARMSAKNKLVLAATGAHRRVTH